MTVEEIIIELEATQGKSDLPEEFEIALKNAFSFLGYQAKKIGGKSDTDVLLTANIGNQSYKVDVDGKTSKKLKVSDAQINWISLKDHKIKNNSDFVIVVGPGFAGGNLEKRAKDFGISLLSTDELIKIIKAHSKYPFTLLELKDLFAGAGSLTDQVIDLLDQNSIRRSFLEKFRIIIEEIDILQNTNTGYFTFESIAGREKIQDLEIELEDIKSIIELLKIPFINAIYEIGENKFVFTLEKKDLSNTFYQISSLIGKKVIPPIIETEKSKKEPESFEPEQRNFGTKYYEWEKRGSSIFAIARKGNPYSHSCPIEHFNTILTKVQNIFDNQSIINNDNIFRSLINQELAQNRIFKGKSEEYKIRMILGILELEGFIKWTGSLRPIEYTLESSIKEIEKFKKTVLES